MDQPEPTETARGQELVTLIFTSTPLGKTVNTLLPSSNPETSPAFFLTKKRGDREPVDGRKQAPSGAFLIKCQIQRGTLSKAISAGRARDKITQLWDRGAFSQLEN